MPEHTSAASGPSAGSRQGRQIRSEAHGPHWVAWISDASGKPEGSVVLVGETREEAEERARKWADATARK